MLRKVHEQTSKSMIIRFLFILYIINMQKRPVNERWGSPSPVPLLNYVNILYYVEARGRRPQSSFTGRFYMLFQKQIYLSYIQKPFDFESDFSENKKKDENKRGFWVGISEYLGVKLEKQFGVAWILGRISELRCFVNFGSDFKPQVQRGFWVGFQSLGIAWILGRISKLRCSVDFGSDFRAQVQRGFWVGFYTTGCKMKFDKTLCGGRRAARGDPQ